MLLLDPYNSKNKLPHVMMSTSFSFGRFHGFELAMTAPYNVYPAVDERSLQPVLRDTISLLLLNLFLLICFI